MGCGAESASQPTGVLAVLADLRLAPAQQGGTLLFDRFEWTGVAEALVDPRSGIRPRVFLDRAEAESIAASVGMRLPTAEEWAWLASGGRDLRFPWGNAWRVGLASSIELGLDKPLPVGTFELGQTVWGGYDFAGNVWEWVSDAPGYVCGGSFAFARSAQGVRALRRLDPGDRAEDVGFRRVADAPSWFREQLLPEVGGWSDAEWLFLEKRLADWHAGARTLLQEALADEAPDRLLAALATADPLP